MPFGTAVEMERLSEEVNDFMMMEENDIPALVKELEENGECKLRSDVIWNHINYMKGLDGQKRFSRLSKIALLVLTIPHSNAEEERVFSMIRQNKTSFRSSLDEQETLGSIMTIKMELANQPSPKGAMFKFPPSILNDAKKATNKYNKACRHVKIFTHKNIKGADK